MMLLKLMTLEAKKVATLLYKLLEKISSSYHFLYAYFFNSHSIHCHSKDSKGLYLPLKMVSIYPAKVFITDTSTLIFQMSEENDIDEIVEDDFEEDLDEDISDDIDEE